MVVILFVFDFFSAHEYLNERLSHVKVSKARRRYQFRELYAGSTLEGSLALLFSRKLFTGSEIESKQIPQSSGRKGHHHH